MGDEVLSLILELVKIGKADMVNSSVIEYENSLNPLAERKAFVKEVLKRSKTYQNVDDKTQTRAHSLAQEKGKLKIINSLEFLNYYGNANQ